MDLCRRGRRLDPIQPELTSLGRIPAHDLGHAINRVSQQDVLGHHPKVVVDVDPNRVSVTRRMPSLQEHREAIIEDVVTHHRRRRDHRLAHARQP
jgi:hypothetical protein